MKVAVIGSGPAGLSCAAELAKEGYAVTVFESNKKPGGILRYGVPAFRLSEDFVDREVKDITALGELLETTEDRQYARERVIYYHEHVKRDSGASHRNK